jgi:hypothetical protein
MKKTLHIGLLFLALLLQPLACREKNAAEPDGYRTANAVALHWHQLLLELERHTPGYRAPVTARMWAYMGVAAWQAALPGIPNAISLETYFEELPAPPRYAGAFSLPSSLNAAYAEITRHFFPTAPPYLQDKINALEAELKQACEAESDIATQSKSIAYAKKTAQDVWRWAVTDTMGHEGFLYNFDRSYVPPNCTGCWQPTGAHPMPALLPSWGNVRSFLVSGKDVPINKPIPYDEKAGSPFYAQAMEIYSMSKPLSDEHRWIAEFWSDDVPGLTVSPMGRWISIATQAIAQAQLPFPQVLELYLKTAIASSDVMVICWKNKYQYNLERPESYIRRVINPDWTPLHDSPPFPSYPSGHAAMGAATAEVLRTFFGDKFPITDRTHEGRTEFAGKPRSFGSFQEIAQENALSRLSLGVHYRMDCEEGLRIGARVGQRVVSLPLFKTEAQISSLE